MKNVNRILSSIEEKIKRNKLSFATFAMFIILIAIGELVISPGFASQNNLRHLLMISVPYGVMGIGETFVILSGREDLDFSVGAVASMSVVMGVELTNILSPLVGVLMVLVIGFAIGALNGTGVRIFGVPPLIMTFATASISIGVGIAYTSGNPTGRTPQFLSQIATGRLGGIPIIIITWIILSVIAIYILHKTIYGRCLYAAGSNPQASHIAGISTTKIGILTYALSGFFAAFAGLLMLGRVGAAVSFTLGEGHTLWVIAAVVLGGTNFFGGEGGYIGTIGGVLTLVILLNLLSPLGISEGGKTVISGIILVVILIFYARRGTLRD